MVKKYTRRLRLTVTQTCMTANFYDVAIDHPKLSFDEALRRTLGPTGFPRTKNQKLFERECKKAFNLVR